MKVKMNDENLKYEGFYIEYNGMTNLFIEDKKNILNKYFNSLSKIIREKKVEDKIKTPNYSVFSALKFSRPEEQLHSAFIFHLLNPEGSHNQGDIFYRLFMESLIGKTKAKKFINLDSTKYFMKMEQRTSSKIGDGKIDIFIKSLVRSKPFAIIFELKWNSLDSCEDQIYKYYLGVKQSKEFHDHNILMIYLTKLGHKPKLLRRKRFINLINNIENENFYPISYDRELMNWLTLSVKKVANNDLKSSILQYQKYLKAYLK